jgi:alanine-synthesizing transaminase
MEVLFSELAGRLSGSKNPLYVLHDRLKAEGRTVVDLVRGNVNEHGIVYPAGVLKEIINAATDAARVYRPDSLGQRVAREAIARYYGSLNIPADHIVITPGTSVSYWYCFKLLAEQGDEILCPQPSYPLFDYIAQLCGIRLTYYRLSESNGWAIDFEHLESQITSRTRAIVLISPHNPTGMVADAPQLARLAEVTRRNSLPIISDEVFSEFIFGLSEFPRAAQTPAPLVFTLNGFSKLFALPGMKIGWMTISGEPSSVQKAISTLELISDTFLPVNEIAQFAVPEIFQRGQEFLKQYVRWVERCRVQAIDGLRGVPFVPPHGGFYVTVPVGIDEEQAAASLLEEQGILVHPGYFYDIAPDHLVMTFIDDPGALRDHFEKIAKICRRIE